jgi:Flp pilus assembly protein TadD
MREGKSTPVALMLVLMATLVARGATAVAGAVSNDEVCDARADYFLGMEDYPEAVKLHRRVIAAHPDDALAHYHLGFAYGMLGRQGEELAEYRQAASLGLRQWDLFLNLGLAYLEDGDLEAATDALTTAVSLGPDHSEAHFNLGLADERRGMLTRARQEMATSLRLDPKQADARNMLGVIDAEDGDYVDARRIWSDLARTQPDFEPARANLGILDRMADSARAGLFRGASSVAISAIHPPRLWLDEGQAGR